MAEVVETTTNKLALVELVFGEVAQQADTHRADNLLTITEHTLHKVQVALVDTFTEIEVLMARREW